MPADAFDVIVVGAGPAGLMAAGQSALLGARTLLLEKMPSPGRKLLLTGKGRCNLTNTDSISEALAHFNKEGRFLKQVYHQFYNSELRQFFSDLGIPTIIERGGRIFPESQRSRDVLDALLRWTQEAGVRLEADSPAEALLLENERILGLRTSASSFRSSRVILATGGKSYPGTGSTGDGYSLAAQAGHTILAPRPSLVPLTTAGRTCRDLQGLSLKNVTLSAWQEDTKLGELFGELLFTHFGLSGPIVLSLSRLIVPELERGRPVELRIDLKPALDRSQLDSRLLRDIQESGKKQFSTLLEGLLPRKLIPVCLEQTGIHRDKKNSQISSAERSRLLCWLKEDFRFSASGHKGFRQAIVTAGGVDTAQIDPASMGSRLIPGLYFAGEVLNLDADTGGYNLQAAFSTGWAAGRAAGSGG